MGETTLRIRSYRRTLTRSSAGHTSAAEFLTLIQRRALFEELTHSLGKSWYPLVRVVLKVEPERVAAHLGVGATPKKEELRCAHGLVLVLPEPSPRPLGVVTTLQRCPWHRPLRSLSRRRYQGCMSPHGLLIVA